MRFVAALFLSLFLLAQPLVVRAYDRVIVAGGSVTEMVYALGKQDKLVASDTTSLYPEAATKLPKVGYVRGLSAEGLLSLNPDLLLVTHDAGPPHVLDQVAEAGVEVVRMGDDYSIKGLLAQVKQVGALLDAEANAKKLAAEINRKFELLTMLVNQRSMGGQKAKPSVLFLLQHGGGTPLVAGTGTVPDAIITLAGAQNAAGSFEGFKPLNPEAVAQAAPDALLVTERSMQMAGGEAAMRALPGIAGTKVAESAKIITMNDLLILGFGPRLPEAAMKLHQQVF